MKIAESLMNELVDLQGWKAKSPRFGLLDYISCTAAISPFFGYLELLCPSLILHNGDYFLEERFTTANYDAWVEQLGDAVAVQKVMNHLHISSILQDQEMSDALANEIAQQIAASWTRSFADKGLIGEAFGGGLDDAEVTLSKRPATPADRDPGLRKGYRGLSY